MNNKSGFRFLAFSVPILLSLLVSAATRAPGLSQTAPVKLNIPVFAQSSVPPRPEPLLLTDEQDQYPLGLHLEILEDPSGELTIEQVSSPEYDSRFVLSPVAVPNYGYTNSVYWTRFRLDNKTSKINEWLLELGFANMQVVDLYTPLPEGEGFSVKQTGVLRSATTRDLTYPRIVFRLAIPPQTQQAYYLRFKNGASMTLPLTLWTQAAFLSHAILEQILNGLFYGVLIGLLVYNLFLFFSLREVNYLYFVILLASLILEELSYDGYLYASAISNLNIPMQYFQPLFFALLIAAMVLFADSFLELRKRHPRLHKIHLGIVAVWGALVILIPFTSYHFIAILGLPWSLISLLAIFTAGIASWKGGYRASRFFLLAWFGLLISMIWVLLVRLGLTSSNVLSENAYRPGYLWMAVCWSIALADRINLLKSETETANQELHKSENRLSQILEGMPLGVVLYGNDHKPKYANRRTVEILSDLDRGIQPDLSMGRTLAKAIDYFSLKMSGKRETYPIENFPTFSALQGTPAFADDIVMEQGDKPVPLEIWASPIKDETGKVESAVMVFQDITQRKQAEAELAEYRKNLEDLVDKRTEELLASNQQLTIEATERNLLGLSLQQRIEWLSEVNMVHQKISGIASLPETYAELSAKILQLLEAAVVLIVRWERQNDQAEIICYTPEGNLAPDKNILDDLFQKDSSLRHEIESCVNFTWDANQADSLPPLLVEYFRAHDIQSAIFVPMKFHQSVIGCLGVVTSKPLQEFHPLQVNLVERMAFDLADLAQDAQFLDQALELAMVEERNRLARDLHDSVTQVLFSASLMAELLPQRFRRDPEAALQGAAELQRMTRGALAEMRTLLLALRPAGLSKIPLGELLTQLTEAITSRTELSFNLYMDNIPPLPAEVQTAFYRIAQEALNNIVKHALATQVTLSLSAAPAFGMRSVEGWHGEIKLIVRDDGVGFDSADRSIEHFGLGIMRERAEAIHAVLDLRSGPGQGTDVTLVWRKEEG